MPENAELDRLYAEAKSALKKGEYDRAIGLLTQILVIDENYKDVPRLLAQTVKLKRRRWHNHPALWGTLGVALLAGLGFLLSRVLPQGTAPESQPIDSTITPSVTAIPPTATMTLTPMATPIPLTWKRISMGQEFPRDTVTAFAIDKKDPDVIYTSMQNAGVYKTIDGGLSWHPTHYGLSNTQVESLLIDSQDPFILYAGTMDGVYKTVDGGENWFKIGNGTYLLMDYQDNSHIYARDENGIYETTDQGNTWITVRPLNKDCPGTIFSWAIHPANGNTLFVASGKECGTGIYQSDNGGRSWIFIETKDKMINNLAAGMDDQGNYSIYVSYTLFYDNTMYYGGSSNMVSHDGGVTWHDTDAYCNTLRLDPSNSSNFYCADVDDRRLRIHTTAAHIDSINGMERYIVGGTRFASYLNDGIFISPDSGASWADRSGGIGTTRAELKPDPTNRGRIYLAAYYPPPFLNEGTSCTLYRSLDNGIGWSTIKGDASWCGPTFDTANVLYVNEGGKLQQSRNGGDTWFWDRYDPKWMPYNPDTRETIDRTLIFALPSYLEGSQSISANPYVARFIYDVGDVIYYSTDAGSIWQRSTGSEGSWDARLFYTDQSKMIFDIGRYHQKYSTDNGKTWQNCGQDVTTSRSDTRLALELQGSRLYLATPGQGVLVSADECNSWQASNNGLTNLFVNTLAIDPNNINTVYAGTDGGAYISYNSGTTWGQVNDGLLGATVVYSIAVDKESNVYAATPYGVFKLEKK